MATQQTTQQGEFKILLLETIKVSTTNPRKHIDKAKLADLTESIKTKGVLVPILVRPDTTQKGFFELVAGERRFRATWDAGLREIPCIIRELTDDQALEAQVIENLQREDVHPLDEADGYAQLIKQLSYDAETIAAKVGKSKAYVYHRLKLLDLIESVKQAFLGDVINIGHAIMLARLQPDDQKKAFEVIGGESWVSGLEQRGKTVLSPASLKSFIQHNILLKLCSAPWKKDDEQLFPEAGSCKACKKRTGYDAELFSDLTKDDRCTDSGCFETKLKLHLAHKEKELSEELGKNVIKVSDEYSSNEKLEGVLFRNQYKPASKKNECPHTEIALVIDGKSIGGKTFICRNNSCTKHYQSWERPNRVMTPVELEKQKKQRQAEKRKEAIDRNTKIEFTRQVWEKATNTIPDHVLRNLILSPLACKLSWQEETYLAKVLGIEYKPNRNSYSSITEFSKKVLAYSDKFNTEQLLRLIYTVAVCSDVERGRFPNNDIVLLAKTLKIDPKGISRQITKEFDAKEKKKAAKAKKKQPTEQPAEKKQSAKKGKKS